MSCSLNTFESYDTVFIALEKTSPVLHLDLTQDSDGWPAKLFHLMGHYITVVSMMHIINGVGLQSDGNTSFPIAAAERSGSSGK